MMFYMRLALRLGRSLRELLATVSSEELTLWRAFDRLEPIGDWRHDLGYGIIASTVHNVNRGKNSDPATPIDYMPFADKPAPTLAQRIRAGLMDIGKGKGKHGLPG